MRRLVLQMFAVVLVGATYCDTARAQKNAVVGAVWQIKFETKKDSLTTRFRATTDGKVFDSGSEEIGTWTGSDDKAEIKITGYKDGNAKFNGTYSLVQVTTTQPPRWSGKWTPPNWEKSRVIHVKLIRD